jgi:protein gp37
VSLGTPIQWADDTVNPTMGCGVACELRPTPNQLRDLSVEFFHGQFPHVEKMLVAAAVQLEFGGHTSTELFQLHRAITERVSAHVGEKPVPGGTVRRAMEFETILKERFVCYAHRLHLRNSGDVTRPEKKINIGYAPSFEEASKFPGRMSVAAGWPDLFGMIRKSKPWLDFLPRLVFVSDMGDSLSAAIDFEYLEGEIIGNVTGAAGQRHLWLWLTKHPARMAAFGRWLGDRGRSWPDNLVALTTVTSPATVWRAEALREVPSRFKGLSVEPLWDRVELPLAGVDLCIAGGQSGDGAKPFKLDWALDLKRQCETAGTSFFLKQLGSNAWWNGQRLHLRHSHGGDWNEWPPQFRVRQMPAGFYAYRCEKMWQQPVSAMLPS